ncbi:hypothetical protein [Streptomyces sp. NPDC001404]|uniref:hypothetical protein n=1 Tax=Streptomyces sp. NPDC001404 TaxID=3364571 RepID=UPI00369B4726
MATGQTVLAQDLNQVINLLTGTDTATQMTVANRIRAQLTGATSPSGYVGGTAGTAPTTGTFAQGDMVIDGTGACLWVCTAAGTPGTWKRVGSGGYVARRYQSATTQTINAGFTNLNLDTQDYDPRSMWNSTSKAFAIPFSGAIWRVTGRVSGSWTPANVRVASMIYVNGNEAVRGYDGMTAVGYGGGVVSDLLQLNSGDLVSLAVYASVAGSTEGASPGARVYLEIALVDQ